MKIEDIARVAHEANRAYCEALGDRSQLPWDEAPEWQRRSVIGGVTFHRDNPMANPIDSHDNWLREKVADGWAYGPEKDPARKLHPCVRPYHELPEDQRVKDRLFIGVVRALLPA